MNERAFHEKKYKQSCYFYRQKPKHVYEPGYYCDDICGYYTKINDFDCDGCDKYFAKIDADRIIKEIVG